MEQSSFQAQSSLQVAGHPKNASLLLSPQRFSLFSASALLTQPHVRSTLPPTRKYGLLVHFLSQIGLQVAVQLPKDASSSQRSSSRKATQSQVRGALPSCRYSGSSVHAMQPGLQVAGHPSSAPLSSKQRIVGFSAIHVQFLFGILFASNAGSLVQNEEIKHCWPAP
jgi:hypothetical protein